MPPTEVDTGGEDHVRKAMYHTLRAREELITAQQFLSEEGRMIPVLTCGQVLEKLNELIAEVGTV